MPRQRQPEDFLDRAVWFVGVVVFAAPGSEPEQLPVSRAVAGAAKTLGIDERFCELHRMVVNPFPVVGQRAGHLSQNVRRQMRHAHPRQNQEARVIGDETDVAPPRFRVPADVAVAAAQMTRRRTPRQAREGTALRPCQILELLSDRLTHIMHTN
jgi:hypothetical protein